MTTELGPEDVVPAPPGDKSGNLVPTGVPGGVEGGVLGGVPGGVVGGQIGGELGAELPPPPPPPKAPKRSKRRRNLVPIKDVMSHARFTPDPNRRALAMTKTGAGSREAGVTRTAFCVDERGRTTQIRTLTGFPDDPEIDEICRRAVKQWRFKPFTANGKRIRVCTVMAFKIRFE